MCCLSAHAASAALALFLAAPAWAQAHKCQTPGGPVTYSDQPCASAQAGGPITLRPNSMDGSEGRAQDQRAAAAQAASSAASPASRTGRASSHHSNSWACRNALRSLQTQPQRVDAEQFEQERQAASRACGHEVRAKPPREPKARPLRKQRAASSPASREKRRSKP